MMNGLFFTLRLSGGSGSFPRPLKAAEEREYLERAAQGDLEARNLLVEQVRALHAQGIKAPVYITVQWDYYTANRHPEWLIRKPDGAHEGGPFSEPGFYQSLCVNTGYWKFLQEQTLEVMELLGDELDGKCAPSPSNPSTASSKR